MPNNNRVEIRGFATLLLLSPSHAPIGYLGLGSDLEVYTRSLYSSQALFKIFICVSALALSVAWSGCHCFARLK